LIDLIFVLNPNIVRSSGVLDPICSDHCPVFVNIKEKLPNPVSYKRKVYQYSLANHEGLNRSIRNTNWDVLFSSSNVDIIAEELGNLLSRKCDIFIPNKVITIKTRDTPWMNSHIHRLIRRRNRQHKKAKRRNLENDWAKFRCLRNKVTSEVRKAKKEHNTKLDDQLTNTNNSKIWWRLVKHYLKNKGGQNTFPSVNYNDVITDDPESTANAFNNYFTSQSKVDDPDKELPDIPSYTNHVLENIELTVNEVQDVLLSLDTSKATGPDGIGNKVLKLTASSISLPLTKLFNMSLKSSIFPNIWKEASIIPIHKKVQSMNVVITDQ